HGAWIREPTTADTVTRAIDIVGLAQISFWDALIVASAEQVAATYIYSEDLNPGQTIAGVTIVNPLADSRTGRRSITRRALPDERSIEPGAHTTTCVAMPIIALMLPCSSPYRREAGGPCPL